MKCVNCGHENPDRTAYCDNCGKEAHRVVEPYSGDIISPKAPNQLVSEVDRIASVLENIYHLMLVSFILGIVGLIVVFVAFAL